MCLANLELMFAAKQYEIAKALLPAVMAVLVAMEPAGLQLLVVQTALGFERPVEPRVLFLAAGPLVAAEAPAELFEPKT